MIIKLDEKATMILQEHSLNNEDELSDLVEALDSCNDLDCLRIVILSDDCETLEEKIQDMTIYNLLNDYGLKFEIIEDLESLD